MTIDNCWAFSLGGCGSSASEDALNEFASLSFQIEGLSGLCEEGNSVMGPLSASVLCRDHRLALAETDEEAQRFLAMRSEFGRRTECRRSKESVGAREEFRIEGPLLERWFLKETISILEQRRRSQGALASLDPAVFEDGVIKPELIRIAAGTAPFPPPLGLYVLIEEGETIVGPGAMTFDVFPGENGLPTDGRYGARIGGFRFWLHLGGAPEPTYALKLRRIFNDVNLRLRFSWPKDVV